MPPSAMHGFPILQRFGDVLIAVILRHAERPRTCAVQMDPGPMPPSRRRAMVDEGPRRVARGNVAATTCICG